MSLGRYFFSPLAFFTLLNCSACAPHFPLVRKGDVIGTLAFWSSREWGLVIASADGSLRKKINDNCDRPIFFPDGECLLCSESVSDTLLMLTSEGKLIKAIKFGGWTSDISPDGRYVLGSDGAERNLLILDLESSRIVQEISPADVIPEAQDLSTPLWSRKHTGQIYVIVALDQDKGPFWLFRYNFTNRNGEKMFQFPSPPRGKLMPGTYSFDPEETRIVFSQTFFPSDGPSRESHLYVSNVDGTDMRQITSGRRRYYGNPQWSPDGSLLLAEDDTQGAKFDGEAAVLLLMNPDGTNQRRIFKRPGLFFESNDADARWCPR